MELDALSMHRGNVQHIHASFVHGANFALFQSRQSLAGPTKAATLIEDCRQPVKYEVPLNDGTSRSLSEHWQAMCC